MAESGTVYLLLLKNNAQLKKYHRHTKWVWVRVILKWVANFTLSMYHSLSFMNRT
jgi:hypothetical protein